MRSYLFLTLCAIVCATALKGQEAILGGHAMFGGSGEESVNNVRARSDGGAMILGSTSSNDGDISGNHGTYDGLLINVSSAGIVVGSRCFGGSNGEALYDAAETTDGGLILVGSSSSTDGEVSNNHGNIDAWVIKLDEFGAIQWEHSYGGTEQDAATCVAALPDGSYVLAGFSASNDGDVSGHYAPFASDWDLWVFRISATGTLLWQQCLGGSFDEIAHAIAYSADGLVRVVGQAASDDGEVIGNHGYADVWALALDTLGTVQWQRCLGSSGPDIGYDIVVDGAGNSVIAGSIDNDFTGSDAAYVNGSSDAWLVWLGPSGNLIRERAYGGMSYDYWTSVAPTPDGRFLMGGATLSSNSNPIGPNHGSSDMMIAIRDNSLDDPNAWNVLIGGTSLESPAIARLLASGHEYIAAGATLSADGDMIDGDPMAGDIWIGLVREGNQLVNHCFVDLNTNGVQDVGESGMEDVLVGTAGGLFSGAHPTDHYGDFKSIADSGTVVSTILDTIPYYTPLTYQQTTVFPGYYHKDTLRFAFQPTVTAQDLEVSFTPLGPLRAGYNITYDLQYRNVGTDTISGEAYLTPDTVMAFVTSSPNWPIGSDTLFWHFSGLPPYQSFHQLVTYAVPFIPIVNIGDTIRKTAGVLPIAGDNTPGDNEVTTEQFVVASYDPNLKTSVLGPTRRLVDLASDDRLIYLVEFQNTGNATAFDIVLRDTLDPWLIPSSFRSIWTSHPAAATVEGNELRWDFKNIFLPSVMENEPASHGTVAFSVRIAPGIQIGDSVLNKAHIFFDSNPAIITNTAVVRIIDEGTGVMGVGHPGVTSSILAPNPVTDKARVICPLERRVTHLRILDSNGRTMAELRDENEFNVTGWAAGIYQAQVQLDDGSSSRISVMVLPSFPRTP